MQLPGPRRKHRPRKGKSKKGKPKLVWKDVETVRKVAPPTRRLQRDSSAGILGLDKAVTGIGSATEGSSEQSALGSGAITNALRSARTSFEHMSRKRRHKAAKLDGSREDGSHLQQRLSSFEAQRLLARLSGVQSTAQMFEEVDHSSADDMSDDSSGCSGDDDASTNSEANSIEAEIEREVLETEKT